jgi:hypothetical protein
MVETRPRPLFGILLAAGLLPAATSPAAESVRIAEEAIQPQAAIGPSGAIHVVFIQRGNIVVAGSKDRGRTFAAPVTAIDAGGEARGGAQRGPRMGVDAKGRIHVTCPVVLDPAELEKKYPTSELCLVSSSDGGATWTKPSRLNEVEKQAPEALHWMAVEPSGTVHAAWLDRRVYKKGEPGQDIVYTSVVGGKTARNEVIVKDVCECCAPGLAVAPGGAVLVSYREGGAKPSREIWLTRRDPSENRFGSPSRLNREPSLLRSCPMSAPAVAVSRDGKLIATAWMDEASGERDARLSIARDGEFGPPETLGEDRAGRQDHPAVSFGEDGALWAAWEDGNRGKCRILHRRDRGKVEEGSSRAQGSAEFPALAAGSGLVVLVYEASKDGDESVHCRVLAGP